jgi:hypothetical protein
VELSVSEFVDQVGGNSSVAFTLDTYAHVMPGMQPEAAERFMELVHGPLEDDNNGRRPSRRRAE